MQKIIILLISLASFSSCTKSSSAGKTTVTTIKSSVVVDTLTVVDNGVTYFDTGAGAISCQIYKSTFNAVLDLAQNAASDFPVSIGISSAAGALNGLGVYKLTPIDSSGGNVENFFAENFNGGEFYTVDSVRLNIDTAYQQKIFGTYEVWLNNAAGSKIVTGIIRCYDATVD